MMIDTTEVLVEHRETLQDLLLESKMLYFDA